jgi:hypothetical protein
MLNTFTQHTGLGALAMWQWAIFFSSVVGQRKGPSAGQGGGTEEGAQCTGNACRTACSIPQCQEPKVAFFAAAPG